jgi:hypothetical protein
VLLAVMAWLIAAACVAVGARRLRKILVLAAESEALLSDLRKARRGGERWSDYPRIVRELGPSLSADTPEESVIALNERLGDVARELAVGAELPAVSARVALFTAVFLAVVELSRTLAGPGGPALGTSGAALAAGITAAAVGFDLSRRARNAADRARGAWNTLSALVSGAGKNLPAGSRV